MGTSDDTGETGDDRTTKTGDYETTRSTTMTAPKDKDEGQAPQQNHGRGTIERHRCTQDNPLGKTIDNGGAASPPPPPHFMQGNFLLILLIL